MPHITEKPQIEWAKSVHHRNRTLTLYSQSSYGLIRAGFFFCANSPHYSLADLFREHQLREDSRIYLGNCSAKSFFHHTLGISLSRPATMAPSAENHSRSHSLLLFQKLLNLRDGASPLTLMLDSLEQGAAPVLREFVSRAKVCAFGFHDSVDR